MTLRLFARRIASAVAGGLLLSIATIIHGHADAAEVKVLTSVALTTALNELAPKFEQATGNKLNISPISGNEFWKAKLRTLLFCRGP